MTSSALADLATVCGAALLGWALLAPLLPLLRRHLLDRPNARSAHDQPTPRGGGVAFVLVGVLWGLPPIPLLCLPLALVGLLDDRLDLPAGLRYGVQVLTALAVLGTTTLPLPHGGLGLLLALGLVVAITATINGINFMDGLDGLVGGCLSIVLAVASVSLQAGWIWPLVGALLGFLIWNRSPARVFMGDVGSTFLGAVLSAVVLQEPAPEQALGLWLVAFPLLADAGVCLMRRYLAGRPVFRAHRQHLYQRLQRAGVSSRTISAGYAIAVGLQGAAFLLGGLKAVALMSCGVVLVGIHIERTHAIPFSES